jgi:CRP/FNR family cyclic AMP-dependent transcriptional regulator
MISPEQLQKLHAVEKTFSPGAVILNEGDATGSLYVIAVGSVKIEKKTARGDAKTIAVLEAGEFFGEMAFVENAPHSATAIAREQTTIFVLPRATLDDLIKKDPRLALDQSLVILAGASLRLRRTTRELVTVFDVARLIGQNLPLPEFTKKLLELLAEAMGPEVTIGFYRWNPYNDEYTLLAKSNAAGNYPEAAEPTAHIFINDPHVVAAMIQMSEQREGALVFQSKKPDVFDAGKKQLIETISAVVAPALATARAREEEEALKRLNQGRQERYSA